MTAGELQKIAQQLNQMEEEALKGAYPNLVLIKKILSEIYKLQPKDRKNFEAFHQQLGEKLFEKDISLKEFTPGIFKVQEEVSANNTVEVIDDFEITLRKLLNCIRGEFNNLRRFAFLRFGESTSKTNVLLLHDSYSKNSILTSAKRHFADGCELMNYSTFLADIKVNNSRLRKAYLAMVIFSPNSSASDVTNFLDELNGYFTNVEQIHLIEISNLEKDFYLTIKDIEAIKREVQYLIEIEVVNRELDPFEEKILKKLFSEDYCHTLEYKLISKGFSGSKVIEVTPFKLFGKSAKYVVKIDETTNPARKDKVKGELENFRKYIKNFDNAYSIEDKKTETHIAIKYNFASSDGKIKSESFSSKYKRFIAGELNGFIPDQTIRNLFDINLFKNNWDLLGETSTNALISDLYSSYINQEKISNAIASITNASLEEVKKSSLWINFEKIYSQKLTVRKKVCHGDLHTENFFIDENDSVFLIDFGDTNYHHAVIDFTTLECSIKFRHIPFYVEQSVLDNVENELLLEKSFQSGFRFSSISRKDLSVPFELIRTIRELSNSFVFNEDTKLDYWISLFIITFRQIQYSGLNQLYALKTAEKLGNRIVGML
jgi:hypothetical protein